MSRKNFSEEQIINALKMTENGKPVRDVCRELGVTEPLSTPGSRSTVGWGISDLRELRQLRDENKQLKRIVADLTLDKHILQEVL